MMQFERMVASSQIEILLPELRAYARSISNSRYEAEDLVQDAVERALNTKSCPTGLGDFRHWMFRVLKNLNIDRVRKRKIRQDYCRMQSRIETESIETETWGAHHETPHMVRLLFDSLPHQQQEILFLIDIAGLKYDEAAKILRIKRGTVMSRISRARLALVRHLSDDAFDALPQDPLNEQDKSRRLDASKRIS